EWPEAGCLAEGDCRLYGRARDRRPVVHVTAEAEIDPALQRVRASDESQVVYVLQCSHSARVVREVRVRRRRVIEGERNVRVRLWRQEREEIFADAEDGFVGHPR